MKIRVGQLFARVTSGITEENTYLVCGIIKTDKPLNTEATHIFTTDTMNIIESRDVSDISRGTNLDGIATSPIWRVKI